MRGAPRKCALPINGFANPRSACIMAQQAFRETGALHKQALQEYWPGNPAPAGADINRSARGERAEIVAEGTVDDGGAAVHPIITVDIKPGTDVGIISPRPIRPSVFDDEAIEQSGGIDVVHPHYMKSIIGMYSRQAHIAAEDGGVERPVALIERGFGAVKAAIELDVFVDQKGFEPMGGGDAAVRRFFRQVGALGYPDLIAGLGGIDCGLEAAESSSPGCPVAARAGRGVGIDVDDLSPQA